MAWFALPAAAQNIQPIYSFTAGPARPYAGLAMGPDGNFYGTTWGGGNEVGTVFQITTNGALTTLVRFAYTNGAYPYAGLTLAPDGNFYGTTWYGGTLYGISGSSSYGTIFQLTTNGTLTTVASFAYTNGGQPYAGLSLGPDSNFYGTTSEGGSSGYGTVFRITTNGTVTTLASFAGTNGAIPYAGLALGPDGGFYGTTFSGGITNATYPAGMGTVFKITTDGTFTTLAIFNRTNGATPYAGLTLGPDGNFYGTTVGGGSSGYGTVFGITTSGMMTTLASFVYTNGANPYAALTLGSDGNFYGTTRNGGKNGYGTVLRITTNGNLATLASFAFTNGANPYGALSLGSDGNFYGTTFDGGTSVYSGGKGTVFRVATNGTLTMLASFIDTNGTIPYGLTLGLDGNLYGVTESGGTNGDGTVFRINTNGMLTQLTSFAGTNGANPESELTLGLDGDFYGTTYAGGSSSNGTVFRINTNGTLTSLANFARTNGANPLAGLTLALDGNFYGTAEQGGSSDFYGTVFRIATNGTLTTLANFTLTNGAYPVGLAPGVDGNFYGTTYSGGTNNDGTVFQITTNGVLTTIWSFSATAYNGTPYHGSGTNADGAFPDADLTLGPDGNFYGSAGIGGSGGNGTVFKITTNGLLTTLHSFSSTSGFTNTDGAQPRAGLTLGPDGNFYGTTYSGGSSDYGTAFRITTNGNLTTLASFGLSNGAYPASALTLGPDGNFYGTTSQGGAGGGGMIYRLNLPPSIITQPSNQIVTTGSSATFTIGVFGTAPIEYQWLYNGTPIISATNNTLTIADVAPSSTGDYEVIITNNWGTVTSTVASLSFPAAPTIINQPTSEGVPIGGTASFAVGATGNPPPAYQWYFNTNTPLAGATNAVLSFGPVLTSQAGNYQVIVANPYGSATSGAASLTVLLQPNCYGISYSGSGTVTLLLASTPGSTNRLWAATNLNLPLAQWQIMSTNTADDTGFFQFTDTNTGDGPAKFYILSSP